MWQSSRLLFFSSMPQSKVCLSPSSIIHLHLYGGDKPSIDVKKLYIHTPCQLIRTELTLWKNPQLIQLSNAELMSHQPHPHVPWGFYKALSIAVLEFKNATDTKICSALVANWGLWIQAPTSLLIFLQHNLSIQTTVYLTTIFYKVKIVLQTVCEFEISEHQQTEGGY